MRQTRVTPRAEQMYLFVMLVNIGLKWTGVQLAEWISYASQGVKKIKLKLKKKWSEVADRNVFLTAFPQLHTMPSHAPFKATYPLAVKQALEQFVFLKAATL